MRLRHRLASDPDAVEKAAASAGAQLRPEHHAHLHSLRAAGPVDELLQSGSGQSTRSHEEGEDDRQVLIDFALQAAKDVMAPGYYEALGQTISDQLNHSVELIKNSDWDPRDDLYKLSDHYDITARILYCIPAIGSILGGFFSILKGILHIMGHIIHKPDYDEIQEAFDRAMHDLYDKLMEGVVQTAQDMWSDMLASQDRMTAAELRHKLVVLGEELQFMPSMLMKNATGVAAGFEHQMMLMWLLMVNHDIEVLIALLLGGSRCLPMQSAHVQDTCWEWHKHCTVLQVLDLLVLRSSISAFMAVLEPSWAELLQAKVQSRLTEEIQVISVAKWACMTAAGHSNEVYRNIEKKLPALMKIEGSYNEYLSFHQKDRTTWAGFGLTQGIFVPDAPPARCYYAPCLYTLASHIFKLWQPTDGITFPSSLDGLLLPTSTNQRVAYEEHPQSVPAGANLDCPPGSFLSTIGHRTHVHQRDFFGRIVHETTDPYAYCLQPGAWTTADCMTGEISDSGDRCVRDETACDVITVPCSTGSWAGCPSGMYITQFKKDPCELKCECLRGVGAPGPASSSTPQPTGPAAALSSKVAMRLRHRLASDPDAVEKAAASAGAQLRPEHHAHLHSLRAAGPVDELLQSGSGGSTPGDDVHDSQQFLTQYMTQFAPYAQEPGFYDALGWYTRAQFEYLIASNQSQGPSDPRVITAFEERMEHVVSGIADLVLPGLSAASALNLAVTPWWSEFSGSNSMDTLQDDFEQALTELNANVVGNIKDLMQRWWNETLPVYDSSEARQVRDEFQVFVEHLKFMPSMLSKNLTGVGAGFEQQMVLMWLLLVNHDIEFLGSELLGGSRCFPATTPPHEDCIAWHKNCPVLELLDMTLLHTQVTLAMATLEPSWAISLHEKMQSSLPETLQVIGNAKWACMTAAGERSHEVYVNIDRKLPALLNISGSFDEYLSFQRTGAGVQPVELTGQSLGIVQGFFVDGYHRKLAYHSFKYWQDLYLLQNVCDFRHRVVPSKNGWTVPSAMKCPLLATHPLQPQEIEWSTEPQRNDLVWEDPSGTDCVPHPSVPCQCPPLSFRATQEWECLQPGAWTTGNCMGANESCLSLHYHPPALLEGDVTIKLRSGEWTGCPPGMYMIGPCNIERGECPCRPLLGVGAPGPSS